MLHRRFMAQMEWVEIGVNLAQQLDRTDFLEFSDYGFTVF